MRMCVEFRAGGLALAALLLVRAAVGADRGVAVTYKAPPGGRGGLTGTVKIYDHSLAVVIGIDKYRNQNVPRLTGAVRDARTVAGELRGQGFAVTVLLDDRATRTRIMEVLGDELPNRVGPNDRVLVYFAGHGVSTGEGERALGYLVPVDGDRNRLRSTGISMTELTAWFEDYQCKHVMYVADACYSGLALSTRGVGLSAALSNYLMQITKKRVRMVMTAGGAGEEANEWQGQGLFTRYFLEAIRGAADANHDGIVTSDEIAAYVKPNVVETAMASFRREQNPQVGRSGEGEFVFVAGQAMDSVPPPGVASFEPAAVPRSRVRAEATVPPTDGAAMVLIPAGEFAMGTDDNEGERPAHRVSISAFHMDKFEVTNALFAAFLNTWGRDTNESGQTMIFEHAWGVHQVGGRWDPQGGYENRPVVNVTWYGAAQYAAYYGKRLPTEAEWEYACRAGAIGKWCFGDDEGQLGEYAWYSADSGSQTHPVGQKRPNTWGLYDMHGNVFEWCADWYEPNYHATGPGQNPTGPVFGTSRILRGGSWDVIASSCRSAGRGWSGPAGKDYSGGFRCAMSVGNLPRR